MKKKIDYNHMLHFFEGTASPEEENEITQWLAEEPANRHTFISERKRYDAMNMNGSIEPLSSSKNKIAMHRPKGLRWGLLRYAAIIIVAVLSTLGLQRYERSLRPIAMQTIKVPHGQRININLPDGSNVWLNANTILRYAQSFNSSKERIVELEGEAYFNVSHLRNNKKFLVRTKKYEIEVLGTQFNVRTYSRDSTFNASLLQGKIRLTDRLVKNKHWTLKPGEQALFTKEGIKINPITDFLHYKWRNGYICFKDETFASIMHEFELYYGLQIVIKNDKVKASRFTGKFRQVDGIEYALNVLKSDLPFNYKRDSLGTTLYIE